MSCETRASKREEGATKVHCACIISRCMIVLNVTVQASGQMSILIKTNCCTMLRQKQTRES